MQEAEKLDPAKVVQEIIEVAENPLKEIYSTVFNKSLGLEDFLVFEQVLADELGLRRAQFDLAKALRDFLRLNACERRKWLENKLNMEFDELWEHTSEALTKAIPENPHQDQRDKLKEDVRDLLGRLAQRLPTANRLRLADPLGHEENEADRYDNAFKDVGGHDIEKYREWSNQVAAELERRYPQKPTQSKEYQILGLDAMYEEARKVRPLFMKVAEALAQRTYAVLVKGDLKSIAKAEGTCRVRFGGDVSQICDLVRATLVYHGSVHVMYAALKDMLMTPQMTFEHQHFLRFEDHFVGEPLPGGYRTVTLQVVIDCHVCELQVTVKKMAEAYEKSDRHRAFRNWDEDILSLAMKRDWTHCKLRLSERNCQLLENEIGYIVNVNHARDKLGRVAMHWAASHGELEICDLLAKRRANVSAVDDKGDLPFARALVKGHLEVADFLLKRHADSLHSVNGSREIKQSTRLRLEWLLDWVTDKAQDDERFLPFVRLIAISDPENVIDRVAPGSTTQMRTRLHLACAAGQRGVVRALCQGRSNPNLRDKELCTPLQIAALELNPQGQGEVWKEMQNEGQLLPYSGQRHILKPTKADIMSILISYNADVNAPTGCGMTCLLHVTCQSGMISETEVLLNANAQVNVHDDHGSTPMHLAAHCGFPLILRALTVLGKHVDVNAIDDRGYTPLDVLKDAGHPRECSKHLESRDGRHSLFWAIYNNDLDILKNLLESKADPYVRNRDGESAADLILKRGIKVRDLMMMGPKSEGYNPNNAGNDISAG